MPASSVRSSTRAVALVALIAGVGLTITGSPTITGARVAATNDRFCSVIAGDQGAGVDFDGLGVPEARLAARVIRKAAKTGVPAPLKADLARIASMYDRIAAGEPAAKVLDARQQKAILPALAKFGKYVAANCIATPAA
jgi:hypothetical protein